MTDPTPARRHLINTRALRLLAALIMLWALSAAPAHAKEGEEDEEDPGPTSGVNLSEPGMAMLSFLGAAPAFANEHMSYRFGLGMPSLGGIETGAFQGLAAAAERVRYTSWSVSPELIMNGRWASAHVAFDLHFGREEEIGDGLIADHSFGFRLLYHSGFNVLGFIDGLEGTAAISFGPMLNVGIGPFWKLRGPDGEAEYGHLGLVQLAPSVSMSLLGDYFSLAAMVGYIPNSGIPWNFVEASAGDADGSFEGFEADSPQSVDEASASLETLSTQSAWLLSASASVHLYNEDEPFLTFGARLVWRRHDYASDEGGFGAADAFIEQELRGLITLGIGVPDDYAWQ